MKKLFPLLLAMIGLGVGVGAGLFLRPVPEVTGEADAHAQETDGHAAPEPAAETDPEHMPEYIKLNNQFVIPVVEEGKVASMVIVSLSLEVTAGSGAQVYAREPKLRDAFLQVLFDHANSGGFRGSFTDGANLILLRSALKETAVRLLGDMVSDVLISDIARQDS